MHPYKKYAHKSDPSWLRGLEKYVEKAIDSDIDATIRNYGGDKKCTAEAAYSRTEEKK